MPTLILSLDAPLQSWGTNRRFSVLDTDTVPTKSGVIGMIAAAQGRELDAPLEDLASLPFAVRTDQRGGRVRDFHTAQPASSTSPKVTHRWYLQDWKFLAGIEAPRETLEKIAVAVKNPVYPLFLGRRSCPAGRVNPVIVDAPVVTALRDADWIAADWYRRTQPELVDLTITAEARAGVSPDRMVRDVPLSFDDAHRKYGLRGVAEMDVQVTNPKGRPTRSPAGNDAATTTAENDTTDPLDFLEGL